MMPWLLVLTWILATAPTSATTEPQDPWAKLQQVVELVSQSPAEKVVLTYDPAQRLLRVGRELQLNKITIRRTIQVVPVDRLVREIPLEGVGWIADPWVKVRTVDGRKHVQVSIQREVNGEDVSFDRSDETDSDQAFLIIPCAPREVKKLRDALQAFLEAEQRR